MHYNTLRYRKRVAKMHAMLGGKCVVCSSEKDLHFHHVDPANKSFDLTTEFARPWGQLEEELKKCELRCVVCHKAAHAAKHGLGMYSHHHCRCDVCRRAWSIKTAEYKAARRVRLAAAA